MKYDLQVHTRVSPCSRAAPADVVAAAIAAGLDGIAITDHDTLDGIDAVRAAAPPSLTVIPAVEVTTSQGHLLALGVESVPPQADPLTVVADVHEQDGVAVLSHPFDKLRQYYDSDLDAIAAAVDAVEVRNSRCLRGQYGHRAHTFAIEHDLPCVGGSDAHFPMEVGRAYTECEGDVLSAIRQGETEAAGHTGYASGHVATKLHQFAERVGL